ncbi:hypothetical protein N869_10625 [Cellulomonas bogoriensis 69B4 = DSM 16987]|uniref:SCP domain-containing protein n=1 Tax=Cellulomonas bogoriensis 69B4 = DSM 16987 TaxID=1386082 RepID=A0A0A0BS50_9CELL|nr:hypothetical protein N869_10625 [Cellulomonas bogoriensis 69B4 = DSM 16987]
MSAFMLTTALALVMWVFVPMGEGADHAQAGPSEDLLALVNAARAEAGAGPLTLDPSMTQVATAWSGRMAEAGSISHNPDYAGQIPSGWSAAAENVAFNRPADVNRLHTQWMNSEGHRANILNPRFTHIGIGVVISGGSAWGTQVFATYGTPPAAPREAPASRSQERTAPAEPTAAATPSPEPAAEPEPERAPSPSDSDEAREDEQPEPEPEPDPAEPEAEEDAPEEDPEAEVDAEEEGDEPAPVTVTPSADPAPAPVLSADAGAEGDLTADAPRIDIAPLADALAIGRLQEIEETPRVVFAGGVASVLLSGLALMARRPRGLR